MMTIKCSKFSLKCWIASCTKSAWSKPLTFQWKRERKQQMQQELEKHQIKAPNTDVGTVLGFVVREKSLMPLQNENSLILSSQMTRHPGLERSTEPELMGSRELTRKTQTSRKLQVNQENMLLWGYSWSASCCLFFQIWWLYCSPYKDKVNLLHRYLSHKVLEILLKK